MYSSLGTGKYSFDDKLSALTRCLDRCAVTFPNEVTICSQETRLRAQIRNYEVRPFILGILVIPRGVRLFLGCVFVNESQRSISLCSQFNRILK